MRRAAPIEHHPEINRHPRYFGLPETYFYTLTALAFLLLVVGRFRLGICLFTVLAYLFGAGYLGRLADRHLDLPYRRLANKLRPAAIPPFTQVSLRD